MSIQLSKLCHDVVQNSYKDLHALLDSIGDDDISTRHQRLVEQLLTQRHRFARLLVAVRWFMSYSAFHYSAQATRDLGARRSNVITHGADTMYAVAGVARGAAAHASAVQEAAEVLGSASYLHRIPRCIESGVGIDTFGDAFDTSSDNSSEGDAPHPKSPNRMDIVKKDGIPNVSSSSKPTNHLGELQSEAMARLRAATTDLVGRALPKGVKLIKLGVEPSGAAVRIGVPNAWTADVVLDRLLVAEAFFVLLRFNILVDSSPDAVNDIKQRHRTSERALPLTKDQQEPLRQMLEDRMRWTALSAMEDDLVERARKVLICLCEAMSYDCCGKLALHHIRRQCIALVSCGIWSTQDVSVTEPRTEPDSLSPIHVRYWQRSTMAGTVVISVVSEPSSSDASAGIANFVSVHCSADLQSNNHLLNPGSLDVELLLLHICRDRALDLITSLTKECASLLPPSASMKVSRSSASVISVMLLLPEESPELIFGISLQTGGMLVRRCGILAKARTYSSPYVKALNELLWEGEQFFSKSVPSPLEVLKRIVEKAVAAYDDVTSEATTLHHEKSRKERCANLPESPRVRTESNTYATDRTNKLSVETRSPHRPYHIKTNAKKVRELKDEGQKWSASGLAKHNVMRNATRALQAGRAAAALARADEAIHLQAIDALRELLTREMQSLKVVTTLPSNMASTRAGRAQVPVKTMPMETESSTLHIRGCHGWALRLILRRNVFDTVATSGVVSYFRNTKTLTFTYPKISKQAVHYFRKDLIRARTAAALVTGLSANPGRFKIRHRRPTHVTVEVGDITLSAGLGGRAVEVETYPPRPVITAQLIPLIEEMLNDAGMEMGQRFGELLDRAVPIGQAIQSVLPEDPQRFKVRFLTALRARYVIENRNKSMKCAIDIDARSGRDRMMLIDVARARKVTSNSKASNAARDFSPIPVWDAMLSKLAAKEKGRPVHSGAAVLIHSSFLLAVLTLMLRTFR